MARAGCYLFVFFLGLAVTEASRCYVCNSAIDVGCKDRFDKDRSMMNTTCDSGKCLKIRIDTNDLESTRMRQVIFGPLYLDSVYQCSGLHTCNADSCPCYLFIDRRCGNETMDNDCVDGGLGVETCTCDGDFCNKATLQVVSMATVAFVVFNNLAFRFM